MAERERYREPGASGDEILTELVDEFGSPSLAGILLGLIVVGVVRPVRRLLARIG